MSDSEGAATAQIVVDDDIAATLGDGFEQIKQYGITEIVTLVCEDTSAEYAMEHAEEVYYQRALEVFRKIRID